MNTDAALNNIYSLLLDKELPEIRKMPNGKEKVDRITECMGILNYIRSDIDYNIFVSLYSELEELKQEE